MANPKTIMHDPRMFHIVRIRIPSTKRTSDTSTRMMVSNPPTDVMTGPHNPNRIMNPELNTRPIDAIKAMEELAWIVGGKANLSTLK